MVGAQETDLSASWYRRQKGGDGKHKVVMRNVRNFFYRKHSSSASDALWSVFSEAKRKCSVKDYATAFCPCNARATNAYGTRHHLAYLINVYDHPYVIRWFKERGVTVDQDAFALSQLLQWIWRSAIRNGEAVDLYLPSSRMRRLLTDWLWENGSHKAS